MNYIRHLTGFYGKIQQDERLNPTHISLYLALFQFWNINHFQNPISISRNEMMGLSKISALGTYHKCIKDLQEFGYIEYIPSFNPYKGSLVNLFNFEDSDVRNLNRKRTKNRIASEQALNQNHIKNDTGSGQAVISSINDTNISNRKTILNATESNSLFDSPVIPNEARLFQSCHAEPVEVLSSTTRDQQTTGLFRPPHISEVKMYFAEKEALAEEAEKFFNHYESNGWMVGGRSKMKNWQAAVRNWLMNSRRFNSLPVTQSITKNLKPNHLNVSINKSYQEKL